MKRPFCALLFFAAVVGFCIHGAVALPTRGSGVTEVARSESVTDGGTIQTSGFFVEALDAPASPIPPVPLSFGLAVSFGVGGEPVLLGRPAKLVGARRTATWPWGAVKLLSGAILRSSMEGVHYQCATVLLCKATEETFTVPIRSVLGSPIPLRSGGAAVLTRRAMYILSDRAAIVSQTTFGTHEAVSWSGDAGGISIATHVGDIFYEWTWSPADGVRIARAVEGKVTRIARCGNHRAATFDDGSVALLRKRGDLRALDVQRHVAASGPACRGNTFAWLVGTQQGLSQLLVLDAERPGDKEIFPLQRMTIDAGKSAVLADPLIDDNANIAFSTPNGAFGVLDRTSGTTTYAGGQVCDEEGATHLVLGVGEVWLRCASGTSARVRTAH